MDEKTVLKIADQLVMDLLTIAITKDRANVFEAYNDLLQNCWKLF